MSTTASFLKYNIPFQFKHRDAYKEIICRLFKNQIATLSVKIVNDSNEVPAKNSYNEVTVISTKNILSEIFKSIEKYLKPNDIINIRFDPEMSSHTFWNTLIPVHKIDWKLYSTSVQSDETKMFSQQLKSILEFDTSLEMIGGIVFQCPMELIPFAIYNNLDKLECLYFSPSSKELAFKAKNKQNGFILSKGFVSNFGLPVFDMTSGYILLDKQSYVYYNRVSFMQDLQSGFEKWKKNNSEEFQSIFPPFYPVE
jgi:hypothetical protein